MRTHAREFGSISSEASLTFSEDSGHSEPPLTPPESPDTNIDIHSAPTSPPVHKLDSSKDAAEAFKRLLIASETEADRSTPTAPLQAPQWPVQEDVPTFVTTPTSPTSGAKSRNPGLKMDLSSIRENILRIDTMTPPGAPLLGSIATPDAYKTTFSLTPRPGPVSRFSDEPTPIEEMMFAPDDEFEVSPDLTDGSSASTTPDSTVPGTSPTSGRRVRAPPKPLTLPSVSNAVALASAGPFTPRTVDAFDCFGISSGAGRPLIGRRASRSNSLRSGSPGSPQMLASSPTALRFLPRSPLAMPPAMAFAAQQQSKLTPSTLSNACDEDHVTVNDAKKIYHALLPGEKSHFSDLLASPAAQDCQALPEDARTQPVNPYFVQVQ